MATVCGSTMALMNAGVPITSMVSGIAMGLLNDKAGQVSRLTDISGMEDAFGLMDFKVRVPIKVLLLFRWILSIKKDFLAKYLRWLLAQAKKGDEHILRRDA